MECCVVDMRLPGLNGDEFVIKASQIQAGLEFVLHTGSIEYTLSKTLLELGAQPEDYFYKPVLD